MTNVIKKLGLAALLAAIPVHANAQPKQLPKSPSKAPTHMTSQKAKPSYDSKFDVKKIEWGIGPSYSKSFSAPAEDFLAKDYKKMINGDYTSTALVSNASKPEAKNPSSFGIEASALYPIGKKVSAGIIAGYTSFKQDAESTGGKTPDFPIEADYNWSVKAPFVGLKENFAINDKLNVSLEQKMNFLNIKGDSMITWTNPGVSTRYWDATFSGSGTLFSLGAGAEYKLWKNLWFGASANYISGKIKTKGTQIKTQTSMPSAEYAYNPSFNFNSLSGKVFLNWKFISK